MSFSQIFLLFFFFVGFSFMAALVFIKGNNISFESCRCFSHTIQRCDELKYGWCGGVSMEIRTNNMTFTRKITFITSRLTSLTPFIIWLLIKWMGIHFTFSWMWLNFGCLLLQCIYIYLRWYDCAKKIIIKKFFIKICNFLPGIMRTWWDENFLIMWKWTLLFSTVKYLNGMCKRMENNVELLSEGCFWLFRSFLTFFVCKVLHFWKVAMSKIKNIILRVIMKCQVE